MEPGTFVRHDLRPDWGVGRIEAASTTDKIAVRFRHGVVSMVRSIAEPHLVEVDAADVADALNSPSRRAASAGARCQHCGKALNRSHYARDRRFKSCPRCSTGDGVYHVFHDYPAGFGNSDARVTEGTPDGAQSYCIACRNPATTGTTTGRRCPSVVA